MADKEFFSIVIINRKIIFDVIFIRKMMKSRNVLDIVKTTIENEFTKGRSNKLLSIWSWNNKILISMSFYWFHWDSKFCNYFRTIMNSARFYKRFFLWFSYLFEFPHEDPSNLHLIVQILTCKLTKYQSTFHCIL